MSNTQEQQRTPVLRALAGSFRLGPRPRTRALFYQQFASLLGAGLPLLRSIEALEDQAGIGTIGRKLASMRRHIEDGGDLAGAFEQCPHLFGPVEIAMVRAGERAGRLEEVFARLADSYSRRGRLTTLFVGGVLYPVILLHLGLLIAPFIRTLQNPEQSYLGLLLPRLGLLYGAGFLLFFVPRLARATGVGTGLLEAVRDLIPVYGGLTRKLSLARFARTLGGLYDAGAGLAEALPVAGAAGGSERLRRRSETMARAVSEGRPLLAALNEAGGFPKPFENMVETGESSGQLGPMLGKAADYYADEAQTALTRLVAVLPIVIYLGVAAYIGYEIVRAYADLLGRTMEGALGTMGGGR